MPNWCENFLEVTGPEDQLNQLQHVLDGDALYAGVESVEDRVTRESDAIMAAYPTKWTPALNAVELLANRFQSLTFTLLYYEFNMGLRGYLVFGPDGVRKQVHEDNVDLYAEPAMFPAHYPVPRGSVEWAATARSEDFHDDELENGSEEDTPVSALCKSSDIQDDQVHNPSTGEISMKVFERWYGCEEVDREQVWNQVERLVGTHVVVSDIVHGYEVDKDDYSVQAVPLGSYVLRSAQGFVDPRNGTMPFFVAARYERIEVVPDGVKEIELQHLERQETLLEM